MEAPHVKKRENTRGTQGGIEQVRSRRAIIRKRTRPSDFSLGVQYLVLPIVHDRQPICPMISFAFSFGDLLEGKHGNHHHVE